MKGCVTLAWCVACVALACVRTPALANSSVLCPATKVTSRAVAAIANYRNLTGHWLVKVVLEQEKNSDMRPWHVDVEQRTVLCGDAETIQTTTRFTVPSAYPGPDYQLYAGVGYYKLHAQAQTWSRARQICAEEGAHLAVLNSAQEADVAKELFVPFPKITGAEYHHFAWLGVHERGSRKFYTIFGEPLNSTGFDAWSPGEPDDSLDGCVTLHRNTSKMADISCGHKVAFICEQGL